MSLVLYIYYHNNPHRHISKCHLSIFQPNLFPSYPTSYVDDNRVSRKLIVVRLCNRTSPVSRADREYWEYLKLLNLYSHGRKRNRYRIILLWKVGQCLVQAYKVSLHLIPKEEKGGAGFPPKELGTSSIISILCLLEEHNYSTPRNI